MPYLLYSVTLPNLLFCDAKISLQDGKKLRKDSHNKPMTHRLEIIQFHIMNASTDAIYFTSATDKTVNVEQHWRSVADVSIKDKKFSHISTDNPHRPWRMIYNCSAMVFQTCDDGEEQLTKIVQQIYRSRRSTPLRARYSGTDAGAGGRHAGMGRWGGGRERLGRHSPRRRYSGAGKQANDAQT